MQSKKILVTGGYGFIGSNFIPYFLQKYPNYSIVNLDSLTYAADTSSLQQHPRLKFVHGDIVNAELVNFIFYQYDIQGVIHFAAESHVDNSITNPGIFVKTNIEGTNVLLEAAKNYWMKEPFSVKNTHTDSRFHHISTDEVFGSLGPNGFFTESTPYAPNSPYSASKAGADMLVRSYIKTFGLNAVITHCSNNYGPKQHDEKLIPTIIRHCFYKKAIPLYGDGKNIRDWLYVEDHCKGIDTVFHHAKMGDTFNIGGSNELTNISIAEKICKIVDAITNSISFKHSSLIHFVQDRPGHDKRYAIDNSKLKETLNWSTSVSFDEGLEKTVKWYWQKYSTYSKGK